MGFFNFKDRLADKEVPCRVAGCTSTWTWSKDEQARAWMKGDLTPPARMCERCYVASDELADRELPCAKPGCERTWTWPKAAQVAAAAKGRGTPPKGLCEEHRAEVKTLPDREIPCRVRGCSRTWTWSGRDQILDGAKDATAQPPATMCETCHDRFQALRDERRPCRTPGCEGEWTYTRWQRLEAAASEKAAGDKAEKPDKGERTEPARMCDACSALYDRLSDRELRCRTPGCKRTWKWRRGPQVEAIVGARAAARAEGREAPSVEEEIAALESPSRMCADCSRSYGELADQEVPCKVPGCRNTWTWKRGAQLKDRRKAERTGAGKGKEEAPAAQDEGEPAAPPAARPASPPQRMCDACEKDYERLADAERPCSNAPDCARTWTWTRMAQLIGKRRGSGHAPKHMCPPCAAFLKGRTTKAIVCEGCGTTLSWPPRSQLMTFLGKWVEPTRCGACRTTGTAAESKPSEIAEPPASHTPDEAAG